MARSGSRLVAATTRMSRAMGTCIPKRSTTPSYKTRSRLPFRPMGISVISPKRIVPPLHASKRPTRSRSAQKIPRAGDSPPRRLKWHPEGPPGRRHTEPGQPAMMPYK
jgi:hypothetical protein